MSETCARSDAPWLIPAHAGAPGAVSPLLSALVIKAALFGLLRMWVWLAGPGLSPLVGGPNEAAPAALSTAGALAWVLTGLGVLSIVVGSVMALRQTRLKPLIAYSTVAQVGYWFLGFPILLDPDSESLRSLGITQLENDTVVTGAIAGTIALALGHGIAKAGLFLAAGYLKQVYGTDELAQLRGVGANHPMLLLGMGGCAVGLAGLPLSLGFTGKWELATAAVGSANYWILPVLVIATILSAAYLLKAMSPLLLMAAPDGENVAAPPRRLNQIPVAAQLGPLILGGLTILTGFAGVWLNDVLDVGAPW